MLNFVFHSPTKFVFGKGEENNVGSYLHPYTPQKVLVVYGGRSAERSGLLGRVYASLKQAGLPYVSLSGVQPNPRYELAQEGIALCKREQVDFVLAIGGGSVIDTAKCIAAGALYDGDPWQDFFIDKKTAQAALPVACILTIAAAGSEGSWDAVITHEAQGLKEMMRSEAIRPVLSILNPELTMSLPAYQTACGVTDMFVHITERYFTNTRDVDITDELAEALMRTILKSVSYTHLIVKHRRAMIGACLQGIVDVRREGGQNTACLSFADRCLQLFLRGRLCFGRPPGFLFVCVCQLGKQSAVRHRLRCHHLGRLFAKAGTDDKYQCHQHRQRRSRYSQLLAFYFSPARGKFSLAARFVVCLFRRDIYFHAIPLFRIVCMFSIPYPSNLKQSGFS